MTTDNIIIKARSEHAFCSSRLACFLLLQMCHLGKTVNVSICLFTTDAKEVPGGSAQQVLPLITERPEETRAMRMPYGWSLSVDLLFGGDWGWTQDLMDASRQMLYY